MKKTNEDRLRNLEIQISGIIEQNTTILTTFQRFNQYLVTAGEIQKQLDDTIKMHLKAIFGIKDGINDWSKSLQEIIKNMNNIAKNMGIITKSIEELKKDFDKTKKR